MMSVSNSLSNNTETIINGRFQLIKRLGSGSFGEIFEILDLKSSTIYACKAESIETTHRQLEQEYMIYSKLSHSINFISVYGMISHGKYKLMIMDKLGESLEMLFNYCKRSFSIKTVCLIGIQLISRIEELHKHGWLHRDIKPDNFLIGNGNKQSIAGSMIYMIDLGLAKEWIDNGEHIKHKKGKRLIGTPRYASINTHFGHEQSRRDDLESLAYMLIYFSKSILPWQGLKGNTKEEKYKKIGETKRHTSLSILCNGLPDEFNKYLYDCRNLKFNEAPKYEKYKNYFKNILHKMGYEYNNKLDCLFDWQLNINDAKLLPSHLRFPNKQPIYRGYNNNNNNNNNNNIINNNNHLLNTKNIINNYKTLETELISTKKKNNVLINQNNELIQINNQLSHENNINQNEIIKLQKIISNEKNNKLNLQNLYNTVLNENSYLNTLPSQLLNKDNEIIRLKQQIYHFKQQNEQLKQQLIYYQQEHQKHNTQYYNNNNNIQNHNIIIGNKRRRLIPKNNIQRKRQKTNNGEYIHNEQQQRHI